MSVRLFWCSGCFGYICLMALDGGSEAKGVAIGLKNEDGQALALNQQSRGQEISDGNNTITLRAYVKGEPEAITNFFDSRFPMVFSADMVKT